MQSAAKRKADPLHVEMQEIGLARLASDSELGPNRPAVLSRVHTWFGLDQYVVATIDHSAIPDGAPVNLVTAGLLGDRLASTNPDRSIGASLGSVAVVHLDRVPVVVGELHPTPPFSEAQLALAHDARVSRYPIVMECLSGLERLPRLFRPGRRVTVRVVGEINLCRVRFADPHGVALRPIAVTRVGLLQRRQIHVRLTVAFSIGKPVNRRVGLGFTEEGLVLTLGLEEEAELSCNTRSEVRQRHSKCTFDARVRRRPRDGRQAVTAIADGTPPGQVATKRRHRVFTRGLRSGHHWHRVGGRTLEHIERLLQQGCPRHLELRVVLDRGIKPPSFPTEGNRYVVDQQRDHCSDGPDISCSNETDPLTRKLDHHVTRETFVLGNQPVLVEVVPLCVDRAHPVEVGGRCAGLRTRLRSPTFETRATFVLGDPPVEVEVVLLGVNRARSVGTGSRSAGRWRAPHEGEQAGEDCTDDGENQAPRRVAGRPAFSSEHNLYLTLLYWELDTPRAVGSADSC